MTPSAAQPAPARAGAPTRAWVIWSVGVLAYVVAVLQRTTFGVSGIQATDRYTVSAGVLASFTVLQLVMYAGLQVPVGVALDRFGSRRLIVAGGLTMAAGQLLLALTHGVGAAYLGRALVGTGDAATFISVLRLVPNWFPARRVPVLTQVTGLAGQLGQIGSAVPFLALLHARGWAPAFVAAAATGLLVAVLALVVIHDRPGARTAHPAAAGFREVWADLVSAWLHPGTRLGLWSHFTTQFPGTVFALTWGYPFLVSGEGLSSAAAGLLLSFYVLAGIVAGPLTGVMVQRHPLRRSWLVLGVIGLNAGGWTLVLLWPGPAPLAVIVLLLVCMASGGPGSMIGFDFARTFNPPNRLGTATGIVNVGGFVASLLTILLVGVVLDARTGGAPTYGLADFKVALCVQYLFWAAGLVGIVLARRKARARMAEQGTVVPPIRQVIARRRRR